MTIRVPIKRLPNSGGLPLPSYATGQSAGVDLQAAVEHDVIIGPMERRLIPAGIAVALPEGYEAQIRPRSGLALKNGITVLNSPGTIDADYRGEICVILINLSSEPFMISRGMRIAQMIIAPVSRAEWSEEGELAASARSAGGFGSTGV